MAEVVNNKMNRWNRNKVAAALKETTRRLNHSPSAREAGPPLYQLCRIYFGSFNKAKRVAGLTIVPPKHHRLNKNATILNEDLAYILGVKRGDGYWRRRRRAGAEIGLKVKNLDFAEEFKRRLKEWSRIQPKTWEKNGNFYVALYSIDALNVAQRISLKKIITASKKVKANFLRGLYDSEGGVLGKNLDRRQFACRWIHFSNSNKETISIVSKLLKDFGINHKIKSRIHSGFGSKKLQYEILTFGLENFEKFYKNIGFSIQYKKDKLLEVINSYEKSRGREKYQKRFST